MLLNFKAEGKLKAEAELVNLRKEVLLLGEIQRKCREKMSTTRLGESEQVKLMLVRIKLYVFLCKKEEYLI